MGLKIKNNNGWYMHNKECGTSYKKEYKDISNRLRGNGTFSVRNFSQVATNQSGLCPKIKKDIEVNG